MVKRTVTDARPLKHDPTSIPLNPLSKKHNRGLELIALFKFLKGVVLLVIGVALLTVTRKEAWLTAIIEWADEEMMLPHSKVVMFLYAKFSEFMHGDNLKTTGILALVYAAVLVTESIGVYLEKRWAELLMVFASASLVPFEIYHFSHKPTITKAVLIAANILIVWYLYKTLMKKRNAHKSV